MSVYRPVAPATPKALALVAQLRALQREGTPLKPLPECDAFATQLALDAVELVGGPPRFHGMVNLIGADKQNLVGYAPPPPPDDPTAPLPAHFERTFPLTNGFCPETITRTAPLVLDTVFRAPRFAAGNPVISGTGIKTYMGCRVVVHDEVVGTVCTVGTETTAWGRPGAAFIEDRAAQAGDLLTRLLRQA